MEEGCGKMIKKSTGDKLFKYIITAIMSIVAVIALIPLFSVLAMSLSSKSAVDANMVTMWPVRFTLDSWKFTLTYPALWRAFAITLFSTVTGTFIALLLTALAAYPLSKKKFRLSGIIMMSIVITMIFRAPTVPYFLTLRNLGFYNNILVLIFPHVISAYNLAIMRTFFREFPAEVEEAATIDGCGSFQLLFRIVLPSSLAVLATVGLFYAVTFWNQFQHPLMFIQDPRLYPLQLKIRQLINESNELLMEINSASPTANFNDRTLRAATVIFAIIPIIAVYPYLQKHFVKGAMLGSVKG